MGFNVKGDCVSIGGGEGGVGYIEGGEITGLFLQTVPPTLNQEGAGMN